MMRKLATSPVNAETALATSRIMTSGFLKRERNCSSSELSWLLAEQVGAESGEPGFGLCTRQAGLNGRFPGPAFRQGVKPPGMLLRI